MKSVIRLLHTSRCIIPLALLSGPLHAFQPPNPEELKPKPAQESSSAVDSQPGAAEDPLEAAVGLLPYLSGDVDEQGNFTMKVAVAYAKRGNFVKAEELATSLNVYQRGLTYAKMADLRFQNGDREEGERLIDMTVEHANTVTGGGRSIALAEAAVLMAREQMGDWRGALENIPDYLQKALAMARVVEWIPIEELETQVDAILSDQSPKGRAAHLSALVSAAKNNMAAGPTRKGEAMENANRVLEHFDKVPSTGGQVAARETLELLVALDPENADKYRTQLMALAASSPVEGEWRPKELVRVARVYLAVDDQENANKAVQDAIEGCKGLDHFFWLEGYPAAVEGLFALGEIERGKSELIRVLRAGKNYPHPRASAMAALRVLLLLEQEKQKVDGELATELETVREHLRNQIG